MKKIVLTIAGSDPSGGAGIQADIKSISANGCYAMSVITLSTSQNSHSIKDIITLPLEHIENQIDLIFKDYNVDAVKIGALGNSNIIKLITKKLKEYKPPFIVTDPVMVSKAGAKLLDDNSLLQIERLFKISDLITPNLIEAGVLLNRDISTHEQQLKAVKELSGKYSTNVLLKGGHLLSNELIDALIINGKISTFKNKKIETENTHGTGCTLSSAIAANWAVSKDLQLSVSKSINYLNKAIKNNLNIGNGHGPVDHFFKGE